MVLVPAIIRSGKLLVGSVGESHEDILKRYSDYPKNIFDDTIQRGFVNAEKKFLSRSAAMQFARINNLLNDSVGDEEHELHSDHLQTPSA